MNSHNTKADFTFHKTPLVTEDRKQDAKLVSKVLVRNVALSIADEQDAGCDPYNSTGQHVILQARPQLKD